MEKKLKLLRMHCASCAEALEQELNKLENVKAEISFVNSSLRLEISCDKPEKKLEEVKSQIKKFDSMIKICDEETYENEELKEKKERIIQLSRYAMSFVLSLFAVFIKNEIAKLVIFLIAYLSISYDVIVSAVINVFRGNLFDEKFLMSIASIGAFVIGEYIEAVAVMLLFGLGEILEKNAIKKSRRNYKSALEIKQPYANILLDSENEIKVLTESVKVGDIILIKPGEKVPLDCTIIEGESYLDYSAITGESKEKFVSNGENILSGAINGSGLLKAKVTKLDSDSTITKIIDMVQNATETKTKSEKFISKFSKIYTPIVITLALIIGIVPPIFVGFDKFSIYLYRALCFLVISCPCALVISIPLSYFVAIGTLAKNGVVVKGSNFLEELSKTSCVIFDKTGTLTFGNFKIKNIVPVGEKSNSELLEIVAYAESYSSHKIAKSIVNEYKVQTGKDINYAWINGYSEIAGKGIKANIFMQDTLVGNGKLLTENGIKFDEVNEAGTIIFVAIDKKVEGYIIVCDEPKPDSKLAVKLLNDMGIVDISLSSGDEKLATEAVGEEIGIKNVYYDLLPEDKVLIITDKVQEGKVVCFVGDGINDGPSLANANVGISMGEVASDLALEASDIIVLTDEPSKVANSIKYAKKTHAIAMQNIVGSLAIKLAVITLASIGLASMWLSIFADVGVSMLAILNSLRLSKKF